MITVVGESLVDLVVKSGSDELAAHPGGSPANVAVGLSRLGQRTALVTQIGADGYGALVRAHLESNGVQVVLAGPTDAPTSQALARLDSSGAATYQFKLNWDVRDLRIVQGSAALHVGSLGLVLAPGDKQVLRLVESVSAQGNVVTSYDPNVRPSVTTDRDAAAATAERVAASAHIVKMSDEDAAFLFPHMDLDHLTTRLLTAGTRVTQLLIVTSGRRGAIVTTRDARLSLPAVPVTVVDTLGAGDAFMAALLAGLAGFQLLSPQALAESVRAGREVLGYIVDRALAAAALTCTRPGADPPTTEELDAFLCLLARHERPGASAQAASGARRWLPMRSGRA